jgi:hypothetical protein
MTSGSDSAPSPTGLQSTRCSEYRAFAGMAAHPVVEGRVGLVVVQAACQVQDALGSVVVRVPDPLVVFGGKRA